MENYFQKGVSRGGTIRLITREETLYCRSAALPSSCKQHRRAGQSSPGDIPLFQQCGKHFPEVDAVLHSLPVRIP
jgi:hypothetical protein